MNGIESLEKTVVRGDTEKRRFYGYTLKNIESKIVEEAMGESGEIDAVAEASMRHGLRYITRILAPLSYVDCMRLLLEYGARGNARTGLGLTPAHMAAESGKVTSLRALHAADVSIDRPDIYDATPRRVAEIHGNTECVAFLQQAEEEILRKSLDGHEYRDKDPDYALKSSVDVMVIHNLT